MAALSSLIFGGAACTEAEPGGGDERSAGLACADAIVAGTVVREKTPTTYNDEVPFSAEAHAVVELRRYEAEDAPTSPFLEIDVPVRGLPFDFELCGDASEVFAARDELRLKVQVYNHAGRDTVVGDLVSEYSYPIDQKTLGQKVLVGGLEACDSPDAGGFCL